ncbi:MAG: hypothetical protein NUW37_02155 [Planctomycetes bacterium]|nr:hypothetical protein [Planctomycetota bacterium]
MTEDNIPYAIYSSSCKTSCDDCALAPKRRIYFCVCLMDMHVIGVGDTKDSALESMMNKYGAKYPDVPDEFGFGGFEDEEDLWGRR